MPCPKGIFVSELRHPQPQIRSSTQGSVPSQRPIPPDQLIHYVKLAAKTDGRMEAEGEEPQTEESADMRMMRSFKPKDESSVPTQEAAREPRMFFMKEKIQLIAEALARKRGSTSTRPIYVGPYNRHTLVCSGASESAATAPVCSSDDKKEYVSISVKMDYD